MHSEIISKALNIKEFQVKNTLELLNEGATIPFISRYRKERTGGLDEMQIGEIASLQKKLKEIDERKQTIIKSIEEQGKLTDELKQRIDSCYVMSELEDIYLPYKPKRRTRAGIAREKGLQNLADWLLLQQNGSPEQHAKQFISEKVLNEEEALAGARDIIAETINEDEKVRDRVRKIFIREAVLSSGLVKGKEEEGVKYSDYFNYSEDLRRCPSHRFLAVMRGVSEGVLKMKAIPDADRVLDAIFPMYVKKDNPASDHVEMALEDSYKRLIEPSMETELIKLTKERADEAAIRIFAENLRQLLLASPLGERSVLAIDPGYRTGCKVVCLDNQGNLLHNETIYPHAPQKEYTKAAKKITSLVDAYKIQAIAIGNGTAGRETESFIKGLAFPSKVQVFVVSEDGASVYSASSVAREEFPEYDVTVRGAVSIGRRLMDPLSELVKIDPKSIGVGQYQHDVDQGQLKESLNTVVESCVNRVGVNVNTAGKYLLSYVSGLGPTLAQNVVDYRKENGPFINRNSLKKVPRMGPKAFEQCAGFLRILSGDEPLDNSAVHPESYYVVKQMAKDLSCSVGDLLKNEGLQKQIIPEKYVSADVGLPTLTDILKELAKPGSDPRTVAEVFEFAEGIHSISDLQEGMELPGIVTNITAFGAFVDVGVKQDGLVHISQMSNSFVSDPNTIVKLHQHVKVKVIEVDLSRKRIAFKLL